MFKQQTSSKPMMENKNVAGGRLARLTDPSTDKPTGAYRDGYCRTGSDDPGNHTVGATVSASFLDFTASKGNDLRQSANLQPGQKWCLCSTRWKEVFDAAERGDAGKDAVPKVHLHATEESALKNVAYKDLKKYAIEGEAPSERHTSRQDTFTESSGRTGARVQGREESITERNTQKGIEGQ